MLIEAMVVRHVLFLLLPLLERHSGNFTSLLLTVCSVHKLAVVCEPSLFYRPGKTWSSQQVTQIAMEMDVRGLLQHAKLIRMQ